MKKQLLLLIALAGTTFICRGQITTLHFQVNQTPCATGLTSNAVSKPAISLFPNPSQGIFTVSVKDNKEFTSPFIKVTNVLGETVLSMNEIQRSTDYTATIDLSSFSPGVYFVEAIDKDQLWSGVLKVVLNH